MFWFKTKKNQTALQTKKDTEVQLHAFKKQISRFAELAVDDRQVLKQVLQRLVKKVAFKDDGTIKDV
ncbi:hypothetical protein JRJ22_06310 [Paenibacillus tianjinensis]|uniref:Uncharacterized protein n=1 Tax=Paenibacillus tianjinensis TaxID=2810347 RepID=A0ABX7LL79_9BACL|nr:hypothetical protein JRJ22_06310 [Paenibacillus tianjinensis]